MNRDSLVHKEELLRLSQVNKWILISYTNETFLIVLRPSTRFSNLGVIG